MGFLGESFAGGVGEEWERKRQIGRPKTKIAQCMNKIMFYFTTCILCNERTCWLDAIVFKYQINHIEEVKSHWWTLTTQIKSNFQNEIDREDDTWMTLKTQMNHMTYTIVVKFITWVNWICNWKYIIDKIYNMDENDGFPYVDRGARGSCLFFSHYKSPSFITNKLMLFRNL